MKYYILLLLGFSFIIKAQNKIVFDYDNAGNQIKRELCINCDKAKYKTTNIEAVEKVKDEEMQKFFPEDLVSYYPNPVREELFLKWELGDNNAVSVIQVYNIAGQILQTFSQTEKKNALTIPFQTYPAGTYLIILVYNSAEHKTIKIIKQ